MKAKIWRGALLLVIGFNARAQVVQSPISPSTVYVPPPPVAAALDDWEGLGVAGSSELLVVGRPGREVALNGTTVSGAGQVIVWDVSEGYLKRSWTVDSPVPRTADFFGGAVGAAGRWIAVAHGQSRSAIGYTGTPSRVPSVRMMRIPTEGEPVLGQDLRPTGVDAGLANFGGSVAMQGITLAVTANGAVVIYNFGVGDLWNRSQKVLPPALPGPGAADFGVSIALNGNLLLVSSPSFPVNAGDGFLQNQGRIYIFRRGGDGQFVFEKDLVAPDAAAGDYFGSGLAVQQVGDVEIIAVGAPGKDYRVSESSVQQGAGGVYLFSRQLPSGEWQFDQQFTNFFNTTTRSQLGAGIMLAMKDEWLAVAGAMGGNKGVDFFVRNPDDGVWKRTGNENKGTGYGQGLASFDYGFLIGMPERSLRTGGWDWRATYPYWSFLNQPGTFGGASVTVNRSANADPDGDGILNSDEFFFGSDPLTANSQGVFKTTVDGASGLARIEWEEASETFGLHSLAGWATSLEPGSWRTDGMEIVPLSSRPGSTNKRFEARVPFVGDGNVFFRLMVE